MDIIEFNIDLNYAFTINLVGESNPEQRRRNGAVIEKKNN